MPRSAFVVTLVVACSSPGLWAAEYEIGGPLAGVKLPLLPTQHGEPPGYPGCIPGADEGRFEPQGQAPQLELYPGSLEHWRTYWFKYCPVRSFFDRQSQVKNFLAKDLPGVAPGQVERYASPVVWVPRHAPPVHTGKRREPVDVVRWRPGSSVFRLDLGRLDAGLYVIRVIGAVEPERIRPFLLPVLVAVRVNDGIDGEGSTHCIRIGYVDEFYSVAEVYFYAPRERRYQAELWLDERSRCDLLVHNISLDDVLAGTERRAIKAAMTLHTEEGLRRLEHWALVGWRRERLDRRTRKLKTVPPLGPVERLARDALIWHSLPHPNCQGAVVHRKMPRGATLLFGTPDASLDEVQEAHGKWELAAPRNAHYPFPRVADLGKLLVNEKLGLVYTVDDLAAGRPLPDPYPHKDDGTGLYFPDPGDPTRGWAMWPIGLAVQERPGWLLDLMRAGSVVWGVHRDKDYAHDAAVALCRFAYQFPTMDPARFLEAVTTTCPDRNRRIFRRRITNQRVYGNFIRFLEPLVTYDRLFGYIQGNQQLADSVGRFVPWVESPEDVVQLLDVFLVQTMAKRVLRYQYYGDGRQPSRIAEIAAVLGADPITEPWMEWLFARAFYYPKPLAGIQELMVSNTDRDGRSPIGSRSYTLGDFSAGLIAQTLGQYIQAGGDPRWDLRDPRRYPKSVISTYFPIRMWTAGLWLPRIGDVTGPDKAYAHGFDSTRGLDAELGWRWTRDPVFAHILRHYRVEADWPKGEREAILEAAAKVPRAPWLENRSRVVPGWAGFLEAGVAHDDFRFRRSALLRVGVGYGHGHSDTLDLQLHAHGVPTTVDAGQRGGYSKPGDRHSRVHNVVEVDGKNWLSHSWVRSLADAQGARYLCAQAAPLHGTHLFRRQLALVDVAPGSGAGPLSPQQCGPNPQDLPSDIVTPRSYVFDCFRVAGGRTHTYCLHSHVNDPQGPQPRTNARPLDAQDPRRQKATAYLGSLSNQKVHGLAPPALEVLFQLQKTRVAPGKIEQAGTEQYLLGKAYDPRAPDKFLRAHIVGAEGALVMNGDLHCTKWEYFIPNVYVQRTGDDLESVFAAVLEPYAGEPFIESVRVLPVADNEADALRAVAVQVETVNGHTDLCFADGRPARRREVGDFQVAARFAYCSRDERGLRQAGIVGGTLLAGPEVRLEAATAERRGEVLEARYLDRQLVVSGQWPRTRRPRLVEIGALPGSGTEGYTTGITTTAIEPDGDRATLTCLRGAAYYLSRVKSVDAEKGIVVCGLSAPGSSGAMAGIDRGFVASNDSHTAFWRADVLPGDRATQHYPFRLRGAPVREDDFEPQRILRLWEYGVGDAIRMDTFVSLRRVGEGVCEVDADVDFTLAVKARGLELSPDGERWEALDGSRQGGWFQVRLPVRRLADGPARLRLVR
ncbi:MAG: hypothetical protein ACLF0G_07465 [Candidatus Brocadiia bacterium]